MDKFQLGALPRSYQVTPESLGWRRATQCMKARPTGRLSVNESARRNLRNQLLASDATARRREADTELLLSVDPVPSLAGKTVTGGRLNASKATDAMGVVVDEGEVTVDELPPGTVAATEASIRAASPAALLPRLRLSACTVPKLAGKTLSQAKRALAQAGCVLGRVGKPKAKKGKRLPPLVVGSSIPAAGGQPAGKVDLKLTPKPKPKRHRH